MDDRRLTTIIILILCFLLGMLPSRAAAQAETPAGVDQSVCDDYLNLLYSEPDWRDRLMDPVFSTPDEVRERFNLYWPVYDCLSSGGIPVTGDQAEVRDLTGYFVTLAGGAVNPSPEQGGQGGVLRFADLQDPAVVALRDEVGLPEPEGLIFVWLYPNRESLPENLRQFFANPNVRGLTLLTRYIVIIDNLAELTEEQRGTRLEDYQREQRARVFSHEYVHAYIKSVLGPQQGPNLPKWFDEGLAIYFSGSSEPSSQVYLDAQGRQVWISTPPEEYARYRDTFKYLERVHGREKLLDLIRESVLAQDPAILYRDLGAANEQELFQMSEESREERGLQRLTYGVLGLALLALLIVFLTRLPRREPALAGGPTGGSLDAYYRRSHGDLHGLERMLLSHNHNLTDQAVQTRLAAADELSELNEPGSTELLAMAVRTDKSSSVRAAAARGLGRRADLNRRAAPLDARARVHALEALLPALRNDPVEEVREMAVEALYRTAGTAVLRPLEAILREELAEKRISPGFQLWLVNWANNNGLENWIIDLYPWLGPEARHATAERLRWRLLPSTLEKLDQVSQSGDPALRELADAVLRGRSKGERPMA